MTPDLEGGAETPDQISVVGPSEPIALYQLAARWAEKFSGPNDTLEDLLRRFRYAYTYVDAISDGLEPPAGD